MLGQLICNASKTCRSVPSTEQRIEAAATGGGCVFWVEWFSKQVRVINITIIDHNSKTIVKRGKRSCLRGVCVQGGGHKNKPQASNSSSSAEGTYSLVKTLTPSTDSRDEGGPREGTVEGEMAGSRGRWAWLWERSCSGDGMSWPWSCGSRYHWKGRLPQDRRAELVGGL